MLRNAASTGTETLDRGCSAVSISSSAFRCWQKGSLAWCCPSASSACIFSAAPRMAEQTFSIQPALGNSDRRRCRRRLVRANDLPARLDVHRSIHRSASLRALRLEQVSSSATVLLLRAGRSGAGSAVDDGSDRHAHRVAALAMARNGSSRSASCICPGVARGSHRSSFPCPDRKFPDMCCRSCLPRRCWSRNESALC